MTSNALRTMIEEADRDADKLIRIIFTQNRESVELKHRLQETECEAQRLRSELSTMRSKYACLESKAHSKPDKVIVKLDWRHETLDFDSVKLFLASDPVWLRDALLREIAERQMDLLKLVAPIIQTPPTAEGQSQLLVQWAYLQLWLDRELAVAAPERVSLSDVVQLRFKRESYLISTYPTLIEWSKNPKRVQITD